jgi:hypothetical protein
VVLFCFPSIITIKLVVKKKKDLTIGFRVLEAVHVNYFSLQVNSSGEMEAQGNGQP